MGLGLGPGFAHSFPKPLTPNPNRPLRIGAADSSARLEVGAPLRTERLQPKAELTAVERTLRPASSVIAAASAELDVLPPRLALRVRVRGEG